MRLDDLIEKLPEDTEERVEKARKRFNGAVREILRQETGLRLNRSGRERPDTNTDEMVIVPLAVVPGMPQPLRDMAFTPEEAELLLIGQHRTELLSYPTRRGLLDGRLSAVVLLLPNCGGARAFPGRSPVSRFRPHVSV